MATLDSKVNFKQRRRSCGETVHPNPLGKFLLDVTTDDSRRDIVAESFDAGIHFGEYIQKDMIAVRVSPDHRPAIVASPSYFKSNPKPKIPRDLLKHGASISDMAPLAFTDGSSRRAKKNSL